MGERETTPQARPSVKAKSRTSSTKNQDGERDPSMHPTKKGNQWHFGMKAHIGVDDGSGLVHHVECTEANAADVAQVHKLLHGKSRHDLRRKIENMQAAVALHFAHYNFVRIHRTLRATPAMAAGVTPRLWSLEELVDRTSN